MASQHTRQALHYTTRRSPYFARTLDHGAVEFMVYNHTYMPVGYGRDPRVEYDALRGGVTLWDVGAERQAELRGRDALALADYISPRDLSNLEPGGCRYTPVCDRRGQIMGDCVVLRPFADVVWFSHSDVDLSLWAEGLALHRGLDVEVDEADVAPLQVQGPLAQATLAPLVTGAELGGLARFRCAVVEVAGVPAVVSNTGWSREPGYEVYPLDPGRAVEVWDAIAASGEPHGLLVTGPNIVRAVEQGITDTQYRTNSGMDPLEAGLEHMLDLDGAPFVGRDALRGIRARGPRRRTVGLIADGEPFPRFEDFWPVLDAAGAPIGIARWAVWSYALEANVAIALVDVTADVDDGVVVAAPDGERPARPHAIPFAP